jgi:TonB family protein
MDAVTDVLQAREQRRDAFTPMVVLSAAAHVALFVVLALMSLNAAATPPPQVFMVSFTGSEGPRTGGANAMGGRAVEEVAPPQPKKSPEPPPPPTPKMTVPEDKPLRKPRPEATTARVAPPTPTKPLPGGDEIRTGSTKVETPARGPGFGLSSGGGLSSGVSLDVTDFCCLDYIQKVADRIKQNWKGDQGRAGKAIVRFTIRRDGSLEGSAIEQSSGFGPLDFEAQRAVQLTSRVDRLPAQFTGEQLTVHMTFTYER